MSSLSSSLAAAAEPPQCYDFSPMQSVARFLGGSLDVSIADWVCCDNDAYAEPRGYFATPEVDLFGRLDPAVETTFYDSVCGLPLFVAPRGRSFADFREESRRHGWPSFRPAEVVAGNVILREDGRVESRCRTHLGHNLPDDSGLDRYCLDLVCLAGAPLSPSDENYDILKLLNTSSATTEGDIGEDDIGFHTTASGFSSAEKSFKKKTSSYALKIVAKVSSGIAVMAALYFLGVKPLFRWRRRDTYENIESS